MAVTKHPFVPTTRCAVLGCDADSSDPIHDADATSPRAEDAKADPDPKKDKKDASDEKLPPWLQKKKAAAKDEQTAAPTAEQLARGRELAEAARTRSA